jgi:hypothetical protein
MFNSTHLIINFLLVRAKADLLLRDAETSKFVRLD